MTEIPNFSSPPVPPIRFQIDDDTFEAAGAVGGGVILDLGLIADATEGEQARAIGTFLDAVLLPESTERFAERLRSPLEPITLKQLTKIFQFLVERYSEAEETGRPTKGLSSSRGGSAATGSRSTPRSAKTRAASG